MTFDFSSFTKVDSHEWHTCLPSAIMSPQQMHLLLLSKLVLFFILKIPRLKIAKIIKNYICAKKPLFSIYLFI